MHFLSGIKHRVFQMMEFFRVLPHFNSIFHNKCRKAIFYDRVRSYAASVASCVTLERGRKRLLTRVLNYTFSNSIVLTENKIRNIQFILHQKLD